MSPSEQERLRAIYAEREALKKSLYDPLSPGAFFLSVSRDRRVLAMLREFLGARALHQLEILDVGCGDGNMLRRLVLWGASPDKLCGVDLLESRIERARQLSPNIQFLVGDAGDLPFPNSSWDLALMFTVVSSILDDALQRQVASETLRVLRPGGAILWYDFWLNPTNSDTRGIPLRQIHSLFPNCRYRLRRTTLAPPVARRLAQISWPLCWVLESLPMLCTHYIGLIYKGGDL
ncbi:MAG: class I SAM-dependent methyltransferase [Fimbriimonadales bacterium]|nr:class I SAM-dependent methyltransferase [Fimbriimonadales bacterium]